MSIEAQVLSKVILQLELAVKNMGGDGFEIERIIESAKAEIDPWQFCIDRAFRSVAIPQQGDPQADEVYRGLPVPDRYAVIFGHFNYTVENQGIYGWFNTLRPPSVHWTILEELCRTVKTPVGSQFHAILIGARNILTSDKFEKGDGEDEIECLTQIAVLDRAYTSIKSALILDIISYFRAQLKDASVI